MVAAFSESDKRNDFGATFQSWAYKHTRYKMWLQTVDGCLYNTFNFHSNGLLSIDTV